MSEQYPESVFDVLDHEFHRLINGGFKIDGCDIDAALPQRLMSPLELKAVILHPSASFDTRDATWRYLIVRSRSDADWMAVALGMLQPGMRIAAGRLVRQLTAEPEDIDAEFLTGVIEAISSVDYTETKLANQLITAGVRRVRHACGEGAQYDAPASEGLDHPESVLWRAVDADVINKQDAELIAATRLGTETLDGLTERYGMTFSGLNCKRWRAEKLLCRWLLSGNELSEISREI